MTNYRKVTNCAISFKLILDLIFQYSQFFKWYDFQMMSAQEQPEMELASQGEKG